MSIIFCDGFQADDDCSKKWGLVIGGPSWSDYVIRNSDPRYTGGYYLETYANDLDYIGAMVPIASCDELIVGFGYKRTVPGEGLLVGFYRKENNGSYAGLKMEKTGVASFRSEARNDRTPWDFTSSWWKPNVWHFVEVHYYLHNSTGFCIVKVDGNTVMDYTGDTQATQPDYNIDYVAIGGGANTVTYYSDFYIVDPNTAPNDSFLGDIRIDTIFPNGVGTNNEFTPVGSANHWDNVDDYSTANYNHTNTLGNVDTYEYEAIPDPDNTEILGVALNSTVMDDAAGGAIFEGVYYDGGEYTSPPVSGIGLGVSGTYAILQTIWDRDPSDGNKWEDADIDNHEFGIMMSGV